MTCKKNPENPKKKKIKMTNFKEFFFVTDQITKLDEIHQTDI